MTTTSSQSLKSLNMKWLVSLAIADVIVVCFFVAPELYTSTASLKLVDIRAITTTLMPVAVLLLANVLPHEIKAMLVYWKSWGVLPGTQAFTKYGPNDHRINMTALVEKFGTLPTEPKDQNTRWYSLYRQVSNEIEVAESHKHYLLYRDMAALSLPLILLIPLGLYLAGATTITILISAVVFTTQYLLTALSARWAGVRLVCNVLATHSTR